MSSDILAGFRDNISAPALLTCASVTLGAGAVSDVALETAWPPIWAGAADAGTGAGAGAGAGAAVGPSALAPVGKSADGFGFAMG